jgi:RimJ/RimL family protein N-acetyltransferase
MMMSAMNKSRPQRLEMENPALKVLETNRLSLRLMSADDAEFMLRLLNEPSWLRFIGDRGVRTIQEARQYILNGPVEMYHRLGFGFYVVELKEDETPIGICGLIKREFLEDVDIGYAYFQRTGEKVTPTRRRRR